MQEKPFWKLISSKLLAHKPNTKTYEKVGILDFGV